MSSWYTVLVQTKCGSGGTMVWIEKSKLRQSEMVGLDGDCLEEKLMAGIRQSYWANWKGWRGKLRGVCFWMAGGVAQQSCNCREWLWGRAPPQDPLQIGWGHDWVVGNLLVTHKALHSIPSIEEKQNPNKKTWKWHKSLLRLYLKSIEKGSGLSVGAKHTSLEIPRCCCWGRPKCGFSLWTRTGSVAAYILVWLRVASA